MNGNITTAPLGGNRNIKTKPLFQYDYGQVLKIIGVTLPAAYEVHFSNQLHGVATTQIGNADGVIIPDIYLTTGEPVYAWIYLHTGNADGETEYTITIPVVRRASISDAEPTPVQQDAITQAIAALNTAVEQTAQDVAAAGEAKDDAEEAAGEAYESAVTAGQYATTAGGHAADAAEASHNAEYQAGRAEQAHLDAQAAQWAAESAQTAAEAAQAGAVEARTGAETAQAGAVAARDEIRNMHATANTLPAGSQATASYSDGTLTLGIPKGDKGDQGQKGDTGDRGEQGEKGEKGDTGATGATPDFEIGTVQTLPAGSSATATITGTSDNPLLNLGIPKGDKGDTGEVTEAELTAALTPVQQDVSDLKSAVDDVKAETNSGIIPLNLIANTYIARNGAEVYYANWSSTDFIDIISGGKLHVYSTDELTYNAFYDENKAFISGGTFTVNIGENDINVPATAHFCRMSGTTTAMQNVVVFTDIKSLLTAADRKAEYYYNVFDTQTKTKNNNVYKNCTLASGRVFKGVFESTISTFKCTDYIQIIPKHKYAVYGGYLSDNYRYYFDTSKNIVGVLPYIELLTTYPYTQSSNHMIFTAPDDAGYIRINFLTESVSGDTVPDGFYFVDITDSVTASTKLLVIGDSISADYYGGYPKWVTDLISEGYFLHPNVKNDSIHATGFVARYSSTDDDTFLTRLRTYNQNDYDWIVLFGGINDFIQSINYDTFKAAVDAFFQYLTANFYNKKICVFSPLRTGMTAANNAGHIQQDYQDYIKAVAKSYAIPVLNLTEESGFFPFVEVFKNQWTLLPEGQTQHDGVHPTEAWEKQFLVPIVKDFFRRFYE